MAEVENLQRKLEGAQNVDGGWGYESSNSWTEPTALAMLALEARAAKQSVRYQRAASWLLRNQGPDGGWSPKPGVSESTWVTSLAALALSATEPQEHSRRAAGWIVAHLVKEPTFLMQLIARIRNDHETNSQLGGSPWFPGTAAWVAPTVWAILALSDYAIRTSDDSVRRHVADGQKYLWSRRCRDHGWNHGGSSFRSEDAASYPEMTGMALVALPTAPFNPEIKSQMWESLKRAQSFLEHPDSSEGLSWLQLGLFRHGQSISQPASPPPCRTTRDLALRLLALSAASKTNKLLTPVENPLYATA